MLKMVNNNHKELLSQPILFHKFLEEKVKYFLREKYTIESVGIIINSGTLQKRVHNTGTDSKIISKILEIDVLECLQNYLYTQYRIKLKTNPCQNKYPDCIIYDQHKNKYALDIKTSYLLPPKERCISGFTLGTAKGYFKKKDQVSSGILYPYSSFLRHYTLCLVYSRSNTSSFILKHKIFCEKYRIASKTYGSGNTKNIGSLKLVDDIISGKSMFKTEQEFYEYWENKQ